MRTNRNFSKVSCVIILTILSVLLSTLVVTSDTAMAQSEVSKEKVLREVGNQLVKVGAEQFNRGLYRAAERTCMQVKEEYVNYLNQDEQQEFSELLAKTRNALAKRGSILTHIKAADKLLGMGEFGGAKAQLEIIKDSEFLSDVERQQINSELETINLAISQQQQGLRPDLKDTLGEEISAITASEDARVAEDFLPPAVESSRDRRPDASVVTSTDRPFEPFRKAASPRSEVETSFIQSVQQKRKVQQSYIRAIVNDALEQATKFVQAGQYAKAKERLQSAERIVTKNRLILGDEFFRQYVSELSGLAAAISARQQEESAQLESQRLAKAEEIQADYRTKAEAEKGKRVEELMQQAMLFQDQQRYDDALGQLELLLAIDPMNNWALIMKQTLEDIINFRTQIEVQRRIEREEVNILIEEQRSTIPYADEMTLPDNWRELSERRKRDEIAGLNAVDAAISKQMKEIVDLSMLTPDMRFGDAIEEFRQSVDPSLNIVVVWSDLSFVADITPDSAIGLEGVSAIPLKKGLELVLESVSGGFAELAYNIEDGIITIATKESLPDKLVRKMYDIVDLIAPPAGYSMELEVGTEVGSITGSSGGGSSSSSRGSQLSESELLGQVSGAAMTQSMINIIQESIDPQSWFEGGSITIFGTGRLVVLAKPEVHEEIAKLIDDLRESTDEQVSIEARFLTVDENFLEDIGLDFSISSDPFVAMSGFPISGDLDLFGTAAGSNFTLPTDTSLPGSIGGTSPAAIGVGSVHFLDSLQVDFLIRATQAHRNARSLTAPKVTVLNGESAAIRLETETAYVADIDFETDTSAAGADTAIVAVSRDYTPGKVVAGTVMNVTPYISPDKRYVTLRIAVSLSNILGFETVEVSHVEQSQTFTDQFLLPEVETSQVLTRVHVPDGGTVLLGGQKLHSEVEKEMGIPVLSKIPYLGRFFTNRSKIKDQRVLLILVTPTIILKNEVEQDNFPGLNTSN